MEQIDMRTFAKGVGVSITFKAGNTVFNRGEAGDCMYVVQSGLIDMMIGNKMVEHCGPGEAIGFMSMIDESPRSSTALVREDAELTLLDRRKFRFMIDEVPNFAHYILGVMARRIRGMGQAM